MAEVITKSEEKENLENGVHPIRILDDAAIAKFATLLPKMRIGWNQLE